MTTQESQTEKKGGRVFRGTVVSTKMTDTISVIVERYVKHPKYKKYLRRSKKYLVHAPAHAVAEGQVVSIKEIAPVSKRKTFALAE